MLLDLKIHNQLPFISHNILLMLRVSGCDHMTCSRCETEFCYLCGEKFRGLRFLGNHSSRLSIFGCKYRFQPDNPALRKFARGGLFGTFYENFCLCTN